MLVSTHIQQELKKLEQLILNEAKRNHKEVSYIKNIYGCPKVVE